MKKKKFTKYIIFTDKSTTTRTAWNIDKYHRVGSLLKREWNSQPIFSLSLPLSPTWHNLMLPWTRKSSTLKCGNGGITGWVVLFQEVQRWFSEVGVPDFNQCYTNWVLWLFPSAIFAVQLSHGNFLHALWIMDIMDYGLIVNTRRP